jgi:hypothetical protein
MATEDVTLTIAISDQSDKWLPEKDDNVKLDSHSIRLYCLLGYPFPHYLWPEFKRDRTSIDSAFNLLQEFKNSTAINALLDHQRKKKNEIYAKAGCAYNWLLTIGYTDETISKLS